MAISRRRYRQKWIRWHEQYERKSYRLLQQTFHKWGKRIEWDKMTAENYKSILSMADNQEEMLGTYVDIYTTVGLIHGKRVGRSINSQLKNFVFDQFSQVLLQAVVVYLQKFGMRKITTVSRTYLADIAMMLTLRLSEGKTIRQSADEVAKLVNKPNFYKWQALRIARTETTAAANFGAIQAGTVTGFEMQKEWISSLDKRTRDPHRSQNGQRVPEAGWFNVMGELLQYPGDPQGSAGNVINCRCTVAIVPKRDKNGDLVPTGV